MLVIERRLAHNLKPMFSKADVERLLDRLCVELGFCLPPDEREQLAMNPPDDDVAFAEAVFRAEGIDPTVTSRSLFRQVRDQIAEARNRVQ